MKRPRLPSEIHPDFPRRGTIREKANFFLTHPEFAREGQWAFLCESCGSDVDPDHCWCEACCDHYGKWTSINLDGDDVDCVLCCDSKTIVTELSPKLEILSESACPKCSAKKGEIAC
jgi:hypothetical protein